MRTGTCTRVYSVCTCVHWIHVGRYAGRALKRKTSAGVGWGGGEAFLSVVPMFCGAFLVPSDFFFYSSTLNTCMHTGM